jgi:hypothetical protein
MTHKMTPKLLLAAISALLLLSTVEREAAAEWNYRGGFGFEGPSSELRLNVFIRPYYEFLREADGEDRSTFGLDLVGGRVRVRFPHRRIHLEVAGGLSGDKGILLDSFFDVGLGDQIALRLGYFRVPFDEQMTHAPFWLRTTRRSIDVLSLAHGYDLGIALRGNHLDNSLVWALSMTNGETDWENANIDFLYSARVALRLGRLLGWRQGLDLVIGLGSSWNLEPWNPEMERRPELEVNRSVFNETLDVSLKIAWLSVTAAALFRAADLGAYGPNEYTWGWHTEIGAMAARVFELVARVAHLIPVGGQQQLEVGATINTFIDENRLRFQLEYTYLVDLEGARREEEAHRVVALLQAFY